MKSIVILGCLGHCLLATLFVAINIDYVAMLNAQGATVCFIAYLCAWKKKEDFATLLVFFELIAYTVFSSIPMPDAIGIYCLALAAITLVVFFSAIPVTFSTLIAMVPMVLMLVSMILFLGSMEAVSLLRADLTSMFVRFVIGLNTVFSAAGLIATGIVLRKKVGKWKVNESLIDHFDVIVGVANQHYGYARLKELMKSSERKRLPLCVAISDIDMFDPINRDHDPEDATLCHVVHIIRAAPYSIDLFCRLNGTSFLLAFYDTPLPDAKVLVESLRLRVQAMKEVPGKLLRTTISFGLVRFCPGESAENLVARANTLLQQAQCNGGNLTVVQTSQDASSLLSRMFFK